MNEITRGRPKIESDFEVPGRPGVSVQDLFRADTRPVPEPMLDDWNDYARGGGEPVPTAHYISPEFYKLEVERMWGQVWQLAAHEDQIQNVGDYIVYEIADKSLIIARTAPDTIKAYYNACLHRGRMLCEKDGHAPNFRCKFHGFMWKLDGSLGFVPSKWDFPDLKDDEFRLPEAKVGRWEGFVFISLDPNAGPLEDYLGDMPQFFTNWKFKNRHLTAHVGKVIRANWKVADEAFHEFFHGMATHPQVLAGTSDTATRYVARKERNFGFIVSPTAVASDYVANRVTEQEILDTIAGIKENVEGGTLKLPEGKTAREYLADLKRAELTERTGRDYSVFSDSEMVDLLVFSIFPNVTIFGGYGLPMWYRFRPWQNNPEMSLMEIFFLQEFAEGAAPPPPPKMTLVGPDQTFDDSPELHALGLGVFLNQDLGSMEWVQRGLHTLPKETITLTRYQESEIRQAHNMIDAYIRKGPPSR